MPNPHTDVLDRILIGTKQYAQCHWYGGTIFAEMAVGVTVPFRKLCRLEKGSVVDRFSTIDCRDLLRDTSQPCVSIYLRTYIASPDHHQNPVSLKNLLRQAETLLGDKRENSSRILRSAWELVEGEKFWKRRSAGLAIFASPNRFRSFRIPIQVADLVDHGHRIKMLGKQELFEEIGAPCGPFSLSLQTSA